MNTTSQTLSQPSSSALSFFEKNWKLLAGVLGIFIIAGLLFALLSGQSQRKEMTAQEAYAPVEEKLTKYREQQNAKSEDSKTEKIDVATLKTELQNFLPKYSGTVAAQMAALSLADILLAENNSAEALKILKQAETQDTQLTNALVRKKIGQILADTDQCKEALQAWDKIVNSKTSAFLHNDVKIQQALCYQKLNDTKKAEEILTNIKSTKADGQESAVQEASRILRWIQFNKSTGS